ncbi:MAG: ATP-binding cassette domain-containing protein [Deltaproteobacteria bacterium]|nr:ATP-binding cassette domain-containing protein [Deltaproteobacteria bacterium]
MNPTKTHPVISARGLTKDFGTVRAVRGINFEIREGECFGFLGPNGAGKSSTIRMLYGFSPMTAGMLKILGMDIQTSARKIKARLGVVPQDNNLDTDLTLLENLRVYARYFDLPAKEAGARAEELIHFMQLEGKKQNRVDDLSGGMKRRLILARALLNSPRILLLDEPTTGLDPQARHLIWQRLRSLKKSGVTLVLTTHYMEEAAQLCDRIAVMDQGKIILTGIPREMIREHVGTEVMEFRAEESGDDEIRETLSDLAVETERFGDTLYLYLSSEKDLSRQVTQRLMEINHSEMIHRQATLEDLFLKLTGRDLTE